MSLDPSSQLGEVSSSSRRGTRCGSTPQQTYNPHPEGDAHRMNVSSILYHFHFGDVVCPSWVSEEFCNLTTDGEDSVEEGSIDRQSILETLVSFPSSLW